MITPQAAVYTSSGGVRWNREVVYILQTINRITLFALILSLGLLVDDSIVVIGERPLPR